MAAPADSAQSTLSTAIQNVNSSLDGYTVEIAAYRDSKSPVYLQTRHNNRVTKIGPIHLVKLSDRTWDASYNWDADSYENLKRTAEQVEAAIQSRIQLFRTYQQLARENPNIYIDQERGDVYFFNDCTVVLNEDKTFVCNGQRILYQDSPLKIFLMSGEGVITFQKIANGHIRIDDGIDQRPKKGVFIDSAGKIYRA